MCVCVCVLGGGGGGGGKAFLLQGGLYKGGEECPVGGHPRTRKSVCLKGKGGGQL